MSPTPPRRYREWTKLRELRHDAGLISRHSAAEAFGISYPHYCQIEQGQRGVSDEVLSRMATRLGVKTSVLVRTRPQVPPRSSRHTQEATAS